MDRQHFIEILKSNNEYVILKYGAGWCNPCKKLQPFLDNAAKRFPPNWTYLELDVDVDVDLFAHLTSKRQVKQIPVLLAYKKGNVTPYADHCVMSSDPQDVFAFFERLKKTKAEQ